MLDAAKIRVCPVVYTDVAECLLVAHTALPPRRAPEEKRSFFVPLGSGPASLPRPFRSNSTKHMGNHGLAIHLAL
jgi:hypothetical protein